MRGFHDDPRTSAQDAVLSGRQIGRRVATAAGDVGSGIGLSGRVGRAMARTSMVAWIAAAALAGSARSETFYNQDGILFEGTIRLALSDAAVCNVLEEKYTEQEYERLQANQGRPLHVWRVDLSVRNESGRALRFLRADSWIRSEWPPCTNWDGPEPGALDPFIFMEWTDTLEVLSRPNGMRRDEHERRALYVLAFDGHMPQFGEWDINYTILGGEQWREASGGSRCDRPPAAGDPGGPAPCARRSRERGRVTRQRHARRWTAWGRSKTGMGWSRSRRIFTATRKRGRGRASRSGPSRRRCATCRRGAEARTAIRRHWI